MSILLDQVTKQYQGVPVVNDVSLEIADGQFFVLLGPSGSGKSTLLRAIAGLTAVDHGRITLHGRDVTQLSAREREVGFVFQNYALFRHMTVADNIEFALRVRRVGSAERLRRRRELLELVALEGMDDRLPSQLSGGQQQRVAVARALAHQPKVLLLDEPFGALDAKIREELRRTIRKVQQELGITTILVTHDQEEALVLADRIGVMQRGRLLEAGEPTQLYTRPATRFVATFLGAANLLLRRQAVPVGTVMPLRPDFPRRDREHEVVAVLRPEEVALARDRDSLTGDFLGYGQVEELLFTGALERLRVRLQGTGGGQLPDGPGAVVLEVTRTQPERRDFPVALGQIVCVGARRVHLLPTPLSSFTAFGETPELAARMAAQPWLMDVASRMQTRIEARTLPALEPPATADSPDGPSLPGVAVLPMGPRTPEQVRALLAAGAARILCLPETAPPPQRVVIHSASQAALGATLAVAASLLRHVPGEAVFLGILPADMPEKARTAGVRHLLDVRAAVQSQHGLDIRTELRFGDRVPELLRELRQEPGQMLILGLPESGSLPDTFDALLTGSPGWPVLLV